MERERGWKNYSAARETCPSATLSTTNATGTGLGSNVGLVGLSHGADPIFVQTQLWRPQKVVDIDVIKLSLSTNPMGVAGPSEQAHNRADGQYISVFYGTHPSPLSPTMGHTLSNHFE